MSEINEIALNDEDHVVGTISLRNIDDYSCEVKNSIGRVSIAQRTRQVLFT